jgi:hypothetical protein
MIVEVILQAFEDPLYNEEEEEMNTYLVRFLPGLGIFDGDPPATAGAGFFVAVVTGMSHAVCEFGLETYLAYRSLVQVRPRPSFFLRGLNDVFLVRHEFIVHLSATERRFQIIKPDI